MEEIQVGDQVVQYDRELTRQAYATIKCGGAERCGCSYCRNFVAQRSIAYPASFRALLDQLGIDPDKEGEVYELGPEGGLRLYGGWLFFAGKLISPSERLETELGVGFQYWFTDAKKLPSPGEDFGDDVLAIQIYIRIPWAIEGEP